MIERTFGRRANPPGGSAPQTKPKAEAGRAGGDGAGPTDGTTAAQTYPWQDDPDGILCNFAFGDLAHNLAPRLVVDGRIHAETYLTAAGAIAGMAAQTALFQTRPGREEVFVVTSSAGGKYYFGDPLNRMLMADGAAQADFRVWNVAAGTATSLGVPASDLPSVDDMFGHVTDSLGQKHEGYASVPGHHALVPVGPLLGLVWPFAAHCLNGKLSSANLSSGPKPAPVKWWPAITAWVASRAIKDVSDVLDPKIALVVLMEAAIHASKLDLASLELVEG